MSGFVTSLTELAALIFESFRLPALLPALMFTVANAVLVFPSIKDSQLGIAYYEVGDAEQTVILVLLVAFLTYILTAVNGWLIRLAEGYPLLGLPIFGGWLQARHQDRLRYLNIEEGNLKRKLRNTNIPDKEKEKLQYKLASIQNELRVYYPGTPDYVLPSRFGNVIAAAEDYPRQLYQMDTVVLWPLLTPILTKKGYVKFIEQQKSTVDFLLNTCALMWTLGVELTLVNVRNERIWVAVLQCLAILGATLVLYVLAIEGAKGWGITIRLAFDLYRDFLRQALRLKPVQGQHLFDSERRQWEMVSTFYRDRKDELGNDIFDYSEIAFKTQARILTEEEEEEEKKSSKDSKNTKSPSDEKEDV